MKSPSSEMPGLVSVIVPAYGHVDFVAVALDSVAAQDYEAIELIVLDDCSRDGTFAAVQQWLHCPAAKDRFVRVQALQNPENLGAHGSINRGIELAQGEFLAILNSDDAYAPERIKLLVETSRRTGAQFLFSGIKVIDAKGQRLIEPGLPSQLEAMLDTADAYPSLSFALLVKNIAVSTGNFFFTRTLAQQVGRFRSLRYCHDWDFILRASQLCEPQAVPLPLYLYRVHGSNTYATLKKEEHLEPILVYQHFFSQGLAGHCVNPCAPQPSNWPLLFAALAQEIGNLAWASHVAGDGRIKIDSIMRHLP